MNVQVLSITKTGGENRPRPRPRLQFGGVSLRNSGFTPGALVQMLPELNGLSFVLCDDLRGYYYSELEMLTKQQGGKLMQVTETGERYPHLYTTDPIILDGGLSIGDSLVAVFNHGIIRIRKFPTDIMVIPAAVIKDKLTGEHLAKIRICGRWLYDYGFKIGSQLVAVAELNSVTFTIDERPYSQVVPYERRNGYAVLQVHKEPHNRGIPSPCIGHTGSTINKAGFVPNDVFSVACSWGEIKLQKLDFKQLGF